MIHHSPHSLPFELPLTFQACRAKANGQDEEKELTTPDRNLTHMDPFFERRLMRVLRALEEDGYVPVVLEGYRSPQRQHALRTSAKGQAMTRADACQSYHQLGLASDIAFLHRGRLSLDLHQQWAREAYHTLGHVAEANGLRWGGHWNDFGHLELTLEGKRLAMLQDALSSGAEPLARITSHPVEGDQQ